MMRSFLPVLLVLAVLSPRDASAQNLISNPHFDGNATGWSVTSGAYDGTRDAGGNAPVSGSILGSITGSNAAVPATMQCVPVTAGVTYGFGGKIFIASGQGQTGQGSAQMNFYSTPGCTTLISLPSIDGNIVNTLDTWVTSAGSFTAPPTAVSATLVLWIGIISNGTFQASYDDGFLGVGLTPATLTSFSAD